MRRRRPHQITLKPPKAYILGKEGVGKSGWLNLKFIMNTQQVLMRLSHFEVVQL